MFIDWPRAFAAPGSLVEPNSSSTTTSKMMMCGALGSNIALPIQSGREVGTGRPTCPVSYSTCDSAGLTRSVARSGVVRQRGRRVLPDLLGQLGRRAYPAVFTEPEREPPHPAGVRRAQHDAQTAVTAVADLLARVIVGDPPASLRQLEFDVNVLRRRSEQLPGVHVDVLGALRRLGGQVKHGQREHPVEPEQPDSLGAAAP